jgi:methylmalonic aciduria homocystinuria type C protein
VNANGLGDLRRELAACGLDLVQPFDAAWYNDDVAEVEGLSCLPTFGRSSAAALLIGSTRAFWPVFVERLRADPELQASEHPIDTFVVRSIEGALASVPVPHQVHFGHRRAPVLVSMLRAAEASGLGQLGPAHLAVHPQHGPWFAMRAVVVFDRPADDWLSSRVRPRVRPCAGCAAPCVGALGRAVRGEAPWVAVRDACPVGRDSRYGETQVRYHYENDVAWLRRVTACGRC